MNQVEDSHNVFCCCPLFVFETQLKKKSDPIIYLSNSIFYFRWIDGVSILHVNTDGLVTKHRIDRVSVTVIVTATGSRLSLSLS